MTYREQIRQAIARKLAYEHGKRRGGDARALAQLAARFELAVYANGLQRARVQISHAKLGELVHLHPREIQRIVHRLARTVGLLIQPMSGKANMYRLYLPEPEPTIDAGPSTDPSSRSDVEFIAGPPVIAAALLDHHPIYDAR